MIGKIYNAILSTNNIISDLKILYHIYDQLMIAIIGGVFMLKADYLEEYQNNKKA